MFILKFDLLCAIKAIFASDVLAQAFGQGASTQKHKSSKLLADMAAGELSFEILDSILSFFSTGKGGMSYYQAQQDLLSLCQVNRSWYKVARCDLSHFSHSPKLLLIARRGVV